MNLTWSGDNTQNLLDEYDWAEGKWWQNLNGASQWRIDTATNLSMQIGP